MRLILASNSPRRRELLRNAGIDFEVCPSHVQELRREGEAPEAFARRVACEKALEVAGRFPPGTIVLGADTIVVIEGRILGKPSSAEEAQRFLRMLSGATHHVITGICIARSPHQVVGVEHEMTLVTFRRLDEDDIAQYAGSGEPLDKAGAYGIQGLASKFVPRIEGCYFNVVGLPVARVWEMLRSLPEWT
ncbi:MAG: Maf family protein [Candidatus Dormibacteraceae bacterium]